MFWFITNYSKNTYKKNIFIESTYNKNIIKQGIIMYFIVFIL